MLVKFNLKIKKYENWFRNLFRNRKQRGVYP